MPHLPKFMVKRKGKKGYWFVRRFGGRRMTRFLGTDYEALFRELHAVNAKDVFERRLLVVEIDGRLPQADVIRAISAAVRAGFWNVIPVLRDPKNR